MRDFFIKWGYEQGVFDIAIMVILIFKELNVL